MGRLAAALASTHQVPAVPHSCCNKHVSRDCQMSPGGWGGKSPMDENHDVDQKRLLPDPMPPPATPCSPFWPSHWDQYDRGGGLDHDLFSTHSHSACEYLPSGSQAPARSPFQRKVSSRPILLLKQTYKMHSMQADFMEPLVSLYCFVLFRTIRFCNNLFFKKRKDAEIFRSLTDSLPSSHKLYQRQTFWHPLEDSLVSLNDSPLSM